MGNDVSKLKLMQANHEADHCAISEFRYPFLGHGSVRLLFSGRRTISVWPYTLSRSFCRFRKLRLSFLQHQLPSQKPDSFEVILREFFQLKELTLNLKRSSPKDTSDQRTGSPEQRSGQNVSLHSEQIRATFRSETWLSS